MHFGNTHSPIAWRSVLRHSCSAGSRDLRVVSVETFFLIVKGWVLLLISYTFEGAIPRDKQPT